MTKIKNFRIHLRPREIARWLKKERGMTTTPELELTIEQLIKESKPWITPAAVYTTLTRPIAEKTTSVPFPPKSIALAIVAASIGRGLQDQRAASENTEREPLLAALEQEALAQTVQFAVRLLQDQAKDEDCDLSAPAPAEEAHLATSLAALVGIQKIGIDVDDSSQLLPSYARVAWLFWTPVGKGAAKRLPTGQAGTEKVAV